MGDSSVQIRSGEKRNIYVTQTLPAGIQGLIQSAPAPIVSLLDSADAIAGGINGVTATGYTVFQANEVQVWFKLDNATSPLAPDLYTMEFTYSIEIAGRVSEVVGTTDVEALGVPFMPTAAQFCRNRLQETAESFPDGELYPELDLIALDVYGRFPTLVLSGLTGQDWQFFNKAVGLFTAAAVRPGRPKRAPVGEISTIRTATSQISFDDVVRARDKDVDSIENGWIAEGKMALGKVELIRQYYQANAGWSPFEITGPTRHAIHVQHGETLATSSVRLLTDELIDDVFDDNGFYEDE